MCWNPSVTSDAEEDAEIDEETGNGNKAGEEDKGNKRSKRASGPKGCLRCMYAFTFLSGALMLVGYATLINEFG
jgi:hypothetical protein